MVFFFQLVIQTVRNNKEQHIEFTVNSLLWNYYQILKACEKINIFLIVLSEDNK